MSWLSAFATAAAQLKKIHILCLHHFRTAMFSAHSGMAQDVRTLFQRKCNKLIFDAYQDAAVFDQDFQETKTEFAQYPLALKFLQSLWDNRQSVCATFTAKLSQPAMLLLNGLNPIIRGSRREER